jgi:hypothetical protein
VGNDATVFLPEQYSEKSPSDCGLAQSKPRFNRGILEATLRGVFRSSFMNARPRKETAFSRLIVCGLRGETIFDDFA